MKPEKCDKHGDVHFCAIFVSGYQSAYTLNAIFGDNRWLLHIIPPCIFMYWKHLLFFYFKCKQMSAL